MWGIISKRIQVFILLAVENDRSAVVEVVELANSNRHIRTVFGINASWLRGSFLIQVNTSSKQ